MRALVQCYLAYLPSLLPTLRKIAGVRVCAAGPLVLLFTRNAQLGYVEGCKDGNPGPIPMGLGPKQQINTRNKEPLTFVSAARLPAVHA